MAPVAPVADRLREGLEASVAGGRVELVGPWATTGASDTPLHSYGLLGDARPHVCVAGRTAAGVLSVQVLRAMGYRAVTCPGDIPLSPDGGVDTFIAALADAAARPGAALSGGPDLSVVVTVLNEADTVRALLADVTPLLRAGDELLCVDGGSTDDTIRHLQRWAERDPRVIVVSAPGSNISQGRNIGIRQARNEVIACTDAGCEPGAMWLEALRAPFAENPRPGLVASVPTVSARTALEEAQSAACYPDPHEVRHPSLFVRLYGRAFGLVFNPQLPFARSLAFTREAWTAAGGFPEHLGWQEDGNFGRAVSRHFECVVTADAALTWHQRGTLASTYLMYRRYGFSGAQSGDATLMRRDLVRAAAYVGLPLAVIAAPRRATALATLAVGLYTSLPLRRLQRRGGSAKAAMLVPMAMMVKDIAKVHGAVEGYLAVRRRRRG